MSEKTIIVHAPNPSGWSFGVKEAERLYSNRPSLLNEFLNGFVYHPTNPIPTLYWDGTMDEWTAYSLGREYYWQLVSQGWVI